MLKRHTRAFLCSVIIVITCKPAIAQEDTPSIYEINQSVEADVTAFVLNYREHQGEPPNILDKDAGVLPGISISASGIFVLGDQAERVFALGTYGYASGGAHYYSLSLTGGSPLNYTAPEEIGTASAELGAPIEVNASFLLIPLAELAYRDWHRSLPEAELSTREDYTFFAAGGGARATYALSQRLAVSGKVAVDYTVSPANAGNANPMSGSPAGLYKLGEHPLYELEGEIAYMLAPKISIRFDAAYSRFGFGESQSVSYVVSGIRKSEYEPRSATDQELLRLGLAYSW